MTPFEAMLAKLRLPSLAPARPRGGLRAFRPLSGPPRPETRAGCQVERLEGRLLMAGLHFTSAQAGNWSSPSTWGGAGVPGPGDVVTIQHAVTVNVNATVGTSGPALTAAIEVSAAGALTVANGVTLVSKGDVVVAGTGTPADRVTLGAGSVLEFDAPAGTNYLLKLGTASVQGVGLRCNGTASAHSVIRSKAGGGTAQIVGGLVNATSTDFVRLGTATTDALSFELRNDPSDVVRLVDCTFDTCGRLYSTFNMGTAGFLTLSGVRFRNSTGAVNATLYGPVTTTGAQLVTGCSFDKTVQFHSAAGMTITNNYFHEIFDAGRGSWAAFSGNFVRTTQTNENSLSGSIYDSYWFFDDPNHWNPHFLQANTFPGDSEISGVIFESNTAVASEGDCITIGGASGTLTLRNNIVLPNAAGSMSGTLFSALGSTATRLVVEHNTYFTGDQGAAVSETYAGHAGMVASFRGNLAWDSSGRGYKLFDTGPNQDVPDLVSAADADYNAGWNLNAGSNGKGYHNLEFTSGAPGAHDVDVDPRFVDAARNLASWDRSLGGPGTNESAFARIQADPSLTLSSLIPYVRGGFAPQNAALKGAAHDGKDIGAVPVSTPVGNNAPTLGNVVATLTSIVQDTTDNAGTSVASIVSSLSISDTNAGDGRGIAIVGADDSNGIWQYSINGGATWLALGAVSPTSARLLSDAAANRIRFVPAAGFVGTAALTLHAWDRTSGSDGGTANATAIGGSSPFSAQAATATIAVNPAQEANRPPAISSPSQVTIPANGSIVFGRGQGNRITISDPDAGSNPVQVTLKAFQGTLTLWTKKGLTFLVGDGTDDSEITIVGSLDSINAAINGLEYKRKRGAASADFLSISVNDLGQVGSGGAQTASSSVLIRP